MTDLEERALESIEQVCRVASETGKKTALSIGCTAQGTLPISYITPIRESSWLVAASAIVGSVADARTLATLADGNVDYVFVDVEKKILPTELDAGNIEATVRATVTQSELLYFKGNDITSRSAETLIESHFREIGQGLDGKQAVVFGIGNLGAKIAQVLVERGCHVACYRRNQESLSAIVGGINASRSAGTIASATGVRDITSVDGFDMFISCANTPGSVGPEHLVGITADGLALDAGKGTFTEDALDYLESRGIIPMRLDIAFGWEEMVAGARLKLDQHRIAPAQRSRVIGPVRLVRRGYVGRTGDIIVDDVSFPREIYGVVDALGTLEPLANPELLDVLRKLGLEHQS